MPPPLSAETGVRSRGRLRSNVKINRFNSEDFKLFENAFVDSGCHFRKACKAIGFHHSTVYEFLNKFPDKTDGFKKRAKLPVAMRVLEMGQENDDWRAGAWWLERNFPNEFALTEVHRVEHSGALEHNVNLIPETQLLDAISAAREIEAEVSACN